MSGRSIFVLSSLLLFTNWTQAQDLCQPTIEFLPDMKKEVLAPYCGPGRIIKENGKTYFLSEEGPAIELNLSVEIESLLFSSPKLLIISDGETKFTYHFASKQLKKLGGADQDSTCVDGAFSLTFEEQALYFNQTSEEASIIPAQYQGDEVDIRNGFAVKEDSAFHIESQTEVQGNFENHYQFSGPGLLDVEESLLHYYDEDQALVKTIQLSDFNFVSYLDPKKEILITVKYFRDGQPINDLALLSQIFQSLIQGSGSPLTNIEARFTRFDFKTRQWLKAHLPEQAILASVLGQKHGFTLIDKSGRMRLYRKSLLEKIKSPLPPESFEEYLITEDPEFLFTVDLDVKDWVGLYKINGISKGLLHLKTGQRWNLEGSEIYFSDALGSKDSRALAFSVNSQVWLAKVGSETLQFLGPGEPILIQNQNLYVKTDNRKYFRVDLSCQRKLEFSHLSKIELPTAELSQCSPHSPGIEEAYLQNLGLSKITTSRQLALALSNRLRKSQGLIDRNDRKALQTLLLQDENAVRSLVATYDLVSGLIDSNSLTATCPAFVQSNSRKLQDIVTQQKVLKEVDNHRSSLIEFGFLPLLTEAFQGLEKSAQTDTLEIFTYSFRDAAAKHYQLRHAFESKLYYFSKNYLAHLFGGAPQPITDISIASGHDGKIQPIILKSCLGERSMNSNPFAVCYQEQGLIDNSNWNKGESYSFDYSWKVGTKDFSAKLTLTDEGSLSDLIPDSPSFDYERIKEDGKWVGMVIVSTNTEEDLRDRIRNAYLKFFKDEGFEFSSPQNMYNFAGFMKIRMEQGEIDYLIKEAHSDGDDQNIARFGRSARVHEGRRWDAKGVEHKIYIVDPIFPDYSKVNDELITNADFGSWMRTREQKSLQPLIYFNLSCGSYIKAINEVSSAASPILIPIATEGTRYFFQYSYKDSLKYLLRSFYKEESYDQIRETLNSNDTQYALGKERYLFPDSEEYKLMIRNKLDRAFGTEIVIWDENGKVVEVDKQYH